MSQGSAPIAFSAPKSKSGMAAQLLARILEMCCAHQFSWPHTGVHGQDYQVCVICGAAYQYDWATMRRTGRVTLPLDAPQ